MSAKNGDFPGQHEGEDVQMVFHQHPLVMRKALIFGLLAILASLMIPLFWPLLSWAWYPVFGALVFDAAYWFYAWVGWYYTVYIVTTERLLEVKQKGFFNRQVTEISLERVQNVNYHIKGLQAVLFQYGDITAKTYVGDVVMKTIYKPVKTHEQLVRIVREFGRVETPAD